MLAVLWDLLFISFLSCFWFSYVSSVMTQSATQRLWLKHKRAHVFLFCSSQSKFSWWCTVSLDWILRLIVYRAAWVGLADPQTWGVMRDVSHVESVLQVVCLMLYTLPPPGGDAELSNPKYLTCVSLSRLWTPSAHTSIVFIVLCIVFFVTTLF